MHKLSERSRSERATYSRIPATGQAGKGRIMETVKRPAVARDRGAAGLSRWSTEDVSGSDVSLYDTMMIDTCHYTIVQTHRMCNPTCEPQCALWALLTHGASAFLHQPQRVLLQTRCHGDVGVGGGTPGSPLHFALSFSANLKIL